MKQFLLFCLLTGVLLGMGACNKDALPTPGTTTNLTTGGINALPPTTCLEGTVIAAADLPAAAQAYLAANTSNDEGDDAEKFDDNGTVTYEVDVNDMKLVFDANGNLLASLAETDIAAADLPAAVQSALDAAYPGDAVEEAHNTLGHTGAAVVEVKLASGTELTFEANGNLLCTGQSDDNGDNDNDGDGNNDDNGNGNDNGNHDGNDDENNVNEDGVAFGDLPAAVQALLGNYAGYSFNEADLDTLCEGTATLDVSLESTNNNDDSSLELIFDQSGNLLYTATEINAADLPAAVTASIAANYPGYSLDNDLKKRTLPDGSMQYEVDLKIAGPNDLSVTFAVDGTVLCEEGN